MASSIGLGPAVNTSSRKHPLSHSEVLPKSKHRRIDNDLSPQISRLSDRVASTSSSTPFLPKLPELTISDGLVDTFTIPNSPYSDTEEHELRWGTMMSDHLKVSLNPSVSGSAARTEDATPSTLPPQAHQISPSASSQSQQPLATASTITSITPETIYLYCLLKSLSDQQTVLPAQPPIVPQESLMDLPQSQIDPRLILANLASGQTSSASSTSLPPETASTITNITPETISLYFYLKGIADQINQQAALAHQRPIVLQQNFRDLLQSQDPKLVPVNLALEQISSGSSTPSAAPVTPFVYCRPVPKALSKGLHSHAATVSTQTNPQSAQSSHSHSHQVPKPPVLTIPDDPSDNEVPNPPHKATEKNEKLLDELMKSHLNYFKKDQ